MFEEIKGLCDNILDICCGLYHRIILLGDGRVMSCGYNRYGQCGHGDTTNRTMFEEIKGIPGKVCEIICGSLYTVIRLTNGKIMSCGYNESGQLGHGDTKTRLSFEDIKGIPENISEIFCGDGHMVIRLTDSRLMSCGYNQNGQLGHGDYKNRTSLEEIKGII